MSLSPRARGAHATRQRVALTTVLVAMIASMTACLGTPLMGTGVETPSEPPPPVDLGMPSLQIVTKPPTPTTTTPTTTTPTTPANPSSTLARGTILFDSNQPGGDHPYEIFTMAENGTGLVQLTNDPVWNSWWPQPSPDGRQILFVRTPRPPSGARVHDGAYDETSVWVMNADGSNLRPIIPAGAFGWQLLGHPEWSPDGTRIALFGGSSISPQIFIVNADGTQPVRVTKDPWGNDRPGTNLDPSWSADGRSLLFVGCPVAHCVPEGYEIYSVNADGTGERRLTNDTYRDHDPVISPDGTTVAWLRNTDIGWGLLKANADGSNPVTLIDDGGVSSRPRYSADGTTIWFHHTYVLGTAYSIWRMAADGSRPVQVSQPGGMGSDEYASPFG